MKIAHSVRLARIDVTRMVRKRTDPDTRGSSLVAVSLFVLLTVGLTLGGAWGARALGRELASGSIVVDAAGAATAARGVVGVVWLFGALIFGVRAVGQRGTLANAQGVLTIVSTAEAYLALVAAEWVYLLLWAGLPAVGVGVGLSIGTGALPPVVAVPIAVAVAGLTAVTTGFAVGLAVRHVVTRFPFVARHKTGLIALVFVAYMAVVVTGSLNQAVLAVFDPVSASPLGWYADLALVGVPDVASEATYALGVVAGSVAFAAFATVAGVWIARHHWFADPALAGEEPDDALAVTGADRADVSGDWLAERLEAVLDRPSAALVVLAWRRAARAPLKLMYAAYPLFFATGVFVDVLQTGRVPAYLPYGLLVFVTWAAGVVFTLNPLGDQGAVLPTTLLSEVTGRRFVRAHVLAGLLVAVPAGTAMVAVTAILSPLDTDSVGILVATSPVAMVVAAALSMGIGTAFPRFEATSVTRSMEAVVPSPWAFVLFSLHVVLTAGAAVVVGLPDARPLAAELLSAVLPFELSISSGGLYGVSVATLALLLVLPVLSYRYAVRAFDGYTIA